MKDESIKFARLVEDLLAFETDCLLNKVMSAPCKSSKPFIAWAKSSTQIACNDEPNTVSTALSQPSLTDRCSTKRVDVDKLNLFSQCETAFCLSPKLDC